MAANRRKTIEYLLAPNLSAMATTTALSSTTRYDTSSQTIYVPEVTSRAFLSVRLVATYWTEFTATGNGVTGIRMGSKVGAAATVDVDRTPALLNTASKECWDTVDLDVTANFASNFGSGTSQTFVGSIAIATTAAGSINGVTLKLIITYEFDSGSQNTRIRTVRIPIQSMIGALTGVQQEIGADSTNPATNQIPALDTFLPEASKVYRQIAIESTANIGAANATAFTPYLQIGAAAEIARAVVTPALATLMIWQDHMDVTATLTTSAATTLKARATTTARLANFGAVLVVTYEYSVSATAAASNQIMCSAMVSLTTGSDQNVGPNVVEVSATSAVAADAIALYALLDVPESSPTLVQSGVYMIVDSVSTAGTITVRANGQAYRGYTPSAASSGQIPTIHRCDHGTAPWSLARGPNRLRLDAYNSAPGRSAISASIALINYTAAMPADPDTATHVTNFLGHAYDTATAAPVDVAASSAGQIAPVLGSTWKLQAAIFDAWFRYSGSSSPQFFLGQNAGEFDAAGFVVPANQTATIAQYGSWRYPFPLTGYVNLDSLHAGKLDITTTRRTISSSTINAHVASWSIWISSHQISYAVAGTVTASGSAIANGSTIEIFAEDANGNTERVTTTTVAGGAGAFSAIVLDNTRTYFATYTGGTASTSGRSINGTPGAAFNIQMGGSSTPDVIITSFPAVSTTSTSVSFSFSVSSGSAEYSFDGSAYAAASSPLAFSGLAIGSHTLTIRSVSSPSDLQTFAFSVVAAASPDITITGTPTVTSSSSSATFSFTLTTGSAERSLDGGAYVGCTSPFTLTGLSNAAHSLTIRSVSNPSISETYNWTVNTSSGSSDVTPPVISIVSPTPNTTPGTGGGFAADWATARLTPIVLSITDVAPGNAYQCLVMRTPATLSEEVVYRRGAFRGRFAALSSVAVITNGIQLTILPDGGWPSSDALLDVTFEIDALDSAGNLAA